ncbi:rod shape-determining protein MreD [Psychromonas sp. KJ10-2]|uniref:rod shape-determining protein MreD n=1 Tax=Psychromonas sp. KJ10-2 TaxID=3391822 RepID=UPI0039B36932
MPLLNSYRVIYLTFFVCLVADIFPLPIMFNAFRPNWMILVIFYWIIALPHRVNIGHAFILGLILDLIIRFNIRDAWFAVFIVGVFNQYQFPTFS